MASHGREAIQSIVEACFGPELSQCGGWGIWLEYACKPGGRASRLHYSAAETADYVADLPDDPGLRRSVLIGPMLRVERKWGSAHADPYLRLITGFAVSLDARHLLGRDGLHADPSTWDEFRRVDCKRVAESRVKQERAALIELLQQAVVPPTLAIETGVGAVAFWKLKEPLKASDAAWREVDDVAWQLARGLHGVAAAGLSVGLPVPLVTRTGEREHLTARLLWCKPGRVYDLKSLRALTACRTSELTTRPLQANGRPTGRPPVMLEARTLPEGWTLAELGVPEALLAQASGGGDPTDWADHLRLQRIAEWMAVRRFGLLDVVEILRFHAPAQPLRALDRERERRWCASVFESAAEFATDRDGLRLPYGITRIVPVGERPKGCMGERFVVSGGSRAMPFELEVAYETLTNARAFRRALGKQLGVMPYAVAPCVWDALLTAGLRDRRILSADGVVGTLARPSLATLLQDYVGLAQPAAGSAAAPAATSWPLAKEGLALFPLAHARAWLRDRIPGEALACGQVTAAIRELGGGDYGSLRLPVGRFARCWSLPLECRASPRR